MSEFLVTNFNDTLVVFLFLDFCMFLMNEKKAVHPFSRRNCFLYRAYSENIYEPPPSGTSEKRIRVWFLAGLPAFVSCILGLYL